MNPIAQSREADSRFLASMLTRYGSAKAALVAVRRLKDMGDSGRPWWIGMEARLAYLVAEGCGK